MSGDVGTVFRKIGGGISFLADRGTTSNGQWKYLIQWRGGQLDDSRMMTEAEFKRHECGEQLFAQLKRQQDCGTQPRRAAAEKT